MNPFSPAFAQTNPSSREAGAQDHKRKTFVALDSRVRGNTVFLKGPNVAGAASSATRSATPRSRTRYRSAPAPPPGRCPRTRFRRISRWRRRDGPCAGPNGRGRSGYPRPVPSLAHQAQETAAYRRQRIVPGHRACARHRDVNIRHIDSAAPYGRADSVEIAQLLLAVVVAALGGDRRLGLGVGPDDRGAHLFAARAGFDMDGVVGVAPRPGPRLLVVARRLGIGGRRR